MIKQPHQGCDIIKGSPLNFVIFHQYQMYHKNVKFLLKNNKVILSYPSDHVLEIPDVPDDVLSKLEEEKEMIVWEVNPHTGKIVEKYTATL